MRLLFDEQLPERLCDLLSAEFPDARHVRRVGMGGASDTHIWEYARTEELVVVSKDEDFHRLSVIRGAPPKVVWMRQGNASTVELAEVLRLHLAAIKDFMVQDEVTFLELG